MVVVVVVVAFGLLKESLLKVFPRIPYLNLSSKASWPNRDFFVFLRMGGLEGSIWPPAPRGMCQGHVLGACARGMWQGHVPGACGRGMCQ